VPLLGPDAPAGRIKGKALLVVAGYHFFELSPGNGHAAPGCAGQQRRHAHPAAFLEHQTQRGGLMPQVQTQKLAYSGTLDLIHMR
jgi:hypothetical protein